MGKNRFRRTGPLIEYRHPIPFVNITVGSGFDAVAFDPIHETILRENSDYFKIALGGPFQEAETRSFNLHDNDPAAFSLFVEYLYPVRIRPELQRWGTFQEQCASAFVLGDKLMAPQFQAWVVKQAASNLIAEADIKLDEILGIISFLPDSTRQPEAVKMRKLLATYVAYRMGATDGRGCKPWSEVEMMQLVDCGERQFICDVFGQIGPLTAAKDYTEVLQKICWGEDETTASSSSSSECPSSPGEIPNQYLYAQVSNQHLWRF